MPLKVCLYISALAPGGAERQTVNLARELAGRGVQVTLLLAQKDLKSACYLNNLEKTDVSLVSVFSQDYFKEGVRLSRLHEDFFQNIPVSGQYRLGILYLAGAFSRLRPDIVHSYLDWNNCIAGCAAVLADVPAHLASFCSLDPQTAKNGMAELTFPTYRYLLDRAQPHFEACSLAAVQHYARWLDIAPEAIACSPNGLDPAVYLATSPDAADTFRKAQGIPPTAPVVLTLSRFVWAKAPESILDVFARVVALRPDCHCLIGGSGMGEDEEMGALVRERGLDAHIHLLGVQSDVAPLFTSADVFLLPSRVEGFGIAIMEAMAMGVPVVASNAGGIPDLVRPDLDGFLHEPTDVDGMAQSIVTLLDDGDLRARMGAAGKQRVLKEFSLQKVGDRALNHYERLLAEARLP